MKPNDLIKGLRNKEEEAFRVLVEKFKDRVYNLSFNYLHNTGDAEDLTQEVFIEVYRSVKKFNERAELGTWIYRITINKALEMLRRNKTQKRWGFLHSLFGNEDKYGDYYREDVHPGVSLENKERSQILYKHLDRLPDKQRTVFTLHKMEGKSYSEIAEIMQTTISSVESLMHRAKVNLRKWLGNYYYKNKDQWGTN